MYHLDGQLVPTGFNTGDLKPGSFYRELWNVCLESIASHLKTASTLIAKKLAEALEKVKVSQFEATCEVSDS